MRKSRRGRVISGLVEREGWVEQNGPENCALDSRGNSADGSWNFKCFVALTPS